MKRVIPRHRICANGFRGFPGTRRTPVSDKQVAVCVEFFRQCRPTKTFSRRSPVSYALKHVVENWARRNKCGGYVSNGALIIAALAVGLRIRPHRYGPNATIGLRREDIDRLTKQR
jgi:hypothetical protein